MINEQKIYCPYCGEPIVILVDASVDEQSYIEDCQVCCRPITLTVSVAMNGECTVQAAHENE